jgi:hypothetical protein
MTVGCAALPTSMASTSRVRPAGRSPGWSPGAGLLPAGTVRAGRRSRRQRRDALLFVLLGMVIGVAALHAGSTDLATNRPLRDLPDEVLIGLLAGVIVGVRVLGRVHARG